MTSEIPTEGLSCLLVDKPSITGQSGTVPSNRAWNCSNRKEPRFDDHGVSPQRDHSVPGFKRAPPIDDQKAGKQKVQFAPYPQSPDSPDRSSWMPWTWQPSISSAQYTCRASAVRSLVDFCWAKQLSTTPKTHQSPVNIGLSR